MVKKKTIKKQMKKKKQKIKAKPKKQKRSESERCAVEIGGMQTDVKTFIKKFREDISKKRKGYQSFAQKLGKKQK